MLDASFRPKNEICSLRAYVRHRENLIAMRAVDIQHMQKALHQMNIQLDNVLRDITGITGLKILRAIVAGQRDPKYLAQFRDGRCKNPEEIIAKSLDGNYRPEYLFQLKQALAAYDFHSEQIQECDAAIQILLSQFENKSNAPLPTGSKKQYENQNLRELLYRCCGIDLTEVTGINTTIAQRIVSEIGYDLSKFPTSKNFTSWLNLAPNRRISGGKTLSSYISTPNRAAQALFMAARGLRHTQTPLGNYYRRMRSRLGPLKALVATAHKLARIIYHLLTKRIPFDLAAQERYDKLYQGRLRKSLERKARQFGLKLIPIDGVA